MFKTMKLGTKLMLSFICVALITLLLGGVGYYGAVKSDRAICAIGQVRLPGVDSTLQIIKEGENIRGSVRTLAIPGLPKDIRERQYANIVSARDRYSKPWEVYESLPHAPQEMESWKQFTSAWDAFRVENNKALDLGRQFDQFGIPNPYVLKENLERFRGDHYKVQTQVLDMLQSKRVFEGGENPTECNFGKWIANNQNDNPAIKQQITDCVEPHRHFHEAVAQAKQLVKEGKIAEAAEVYHNKMEASAEHTFTVLGQMCQVGDQALTAIQQAEQQVLGPVTVKQREAIDLLGKVVEMNREMAGVEVKTSATQAAFLKVFSLVAMAVGVVLAISLGLVITRAITKPIHNIIAALTAGADQVAAASGQVSAASQSLAEGSTEQAAGLEEASSSLEEMASMTRKNADNALQANKLAEESNHAASSGSESMKRMSSAISEIQRSSEETAKIVKVIDEIAFQTNLLALNAAVEAARAGEAGKGFAVVAEEVRNLAMRSAEAAKNTASMIEASVKNAQNGVTISHEVGKSLEEIVTSVTQTTGLISEIASAGQEQAQGIDQINTAVAQMDKVTQQNAANAEESASASEELNAQAEQMNQAVNELVALVGGRASAAPGLGRSRKSSQSSLAGPRALGLGKSDHAFHKIATGASRSLTEKAIPLGSQFNEF